MPSFLTPYRNLFSLIQSLLAIISLIISLIDSQLILFLLLSILSFFCLLQTLIINGKDKYLQLLKLFLHKSNKFSEIPSSVNEQKYRATLELLPELILVIDSNGKIILSNKRASEFFDFQELANDQITLVSFLKQSDRDNFQNLFKVVKKEKIMRTMECMMHNKKGNCFKAEITFYYITSFYKTTNFLILINSISATKNEMKEITKREVQNRAIYKMEAIGQLAGGIAHDFNNILGAISGYADIIRNIYCNDKKILKYTQMIISAANHASDLTNKLLTFSRKKRMQMAAFDVHSILSEVLDSFHKSLDKRFTIEFNFQAEQSVIIGDVNQFQSAIKNLVINSQEAMPDGGIIKIETSNLLIDDQFSKNRNYDVTPGAYISIQVTDTGKGIDKQLLDHIFEPFFTTKDSGNGTGLGLASVYGTVKSHQGYIDVETEEGHGTTFTIFIPVCGRNFQGDCNQTDTKRQKTSHILLIDDKNHALDEAVEIISWLGYRVSIVHSYDDSLIILKEMSVDLIIIDSIVLNNNGKERLQKIKAINSSIKILLSVSSCGYEKNHKLSTSEFTGEIRKPFISSQIAQAINDSLNSEFHDNINS